MQCPSCRSDIPDNQFYCPICRASVYSYVPENSRSSSGGRLERAGKRLLEVFLFLILVGIGFVLARAIKWKDLLSGVLPAAATTATPKPDRPQSSQPDSPGKRKATDSSPSKASEGKSADSVKSATAESTSDKKPKEEPSSSESKPTPKPTIQPTPKPPANN